MEIIIAVFLGFWLMAASILSSIWLKKEFNAGKESYAQKAAKK